LTLSEFALNSDQYNTIELKDMKNLISLNTLWCTDIYSKSNRAWSISKQLFQAN